MGFVHWCKGYIGSMFGGMNGLANMAVNALNNQTEILDLKTGNLKSGSQTLVDELLKNIGSSLSNTSIPAVGCNVKKDDFLSRKKAEEIRKNFDKSGDGNGYKLINHIENVGFFDEYKKNSLMLMNNLATQLQSYKDQFNVFTVDKRFKIFPKRVSYNDVWNARKKLKTILKKMINFINDYGPDDYTYTALYKKQSEEILKEFKNADYEELKKELATEIFYKAYEELKKFKDTVIVRSSDWVTLPHRWFTGVDVKISDITTVDDEGVFRKCMDAMGKDVGDDQLTAHLMQCIYLTRGTKIMESGAPLPPTPNSKGYQCCLLVAGAFTKSMANNIITKITIQNGKHMGDYAKTLKSCCEYTEKELDKVINLGAKKDEVDVGNGAGKLGIDLKRLIGIDSLTLEEEEKQDKRNKVLNESINKDLMKNMLIACDNSEKEYAKIEKLANKIRVREGKGKENVQRLKDLKVKLPSRSEESGEADFDIKERLEEIKELKRVAKVSNLTDDEKNNKAALAYRKADKFLRACKKWNEEFKQYEKEEKKRIESDVLAAKDDLKEARKLYRELLNTQGITAEQKKKIKQAYKDLPMFPYTYMRKYTENETKMKSFLGLHFKEGKLLGKDNKEIKC